MSVDYDSILTAVDSNVINSTEFYAIGERARDIGIPMSERAYALCNDDWIVGGMLLMALVLASVIYRHRWLLVHHLKDFFSIKHYDGDAIKDTTSEVGNVLLLATVSALSLSMVYFNDLNDEYGFNPTLGVPYWVLGMGFVVVMCFVYIKSWIYALVNWVFFDHELRHRWMVRYFFITSSTAFILYPISVIDVFVPSGVDIATWGVVLVWCLYEILLLYRLLTNFVTKKQAYLPFFVYFCSVELIPALLLWKGLAWASDSIIVKNILY